MLPKTAKQVEYHEGFANGADECGYGGEEEKAGEKAVRIGIYAVEDDGYMGQELADNVEGTCRILLLAHAGSRQDQWSSAPFFSVLIILSWISKLRLTPDSTKDELNGRILLPCQIQTDGNSSLPDQNCA